MMCKSKFFKNHNIILFCVAIFLLLAIEVEAAPMPNQTTVPIEQIVVAKNVQQENISGDYFTYLLKPIQSGNPMPAGTQSNVYQISIRGNTIVQTDLMTYVQPGTYEYEISQKNLGNNKYVIDESVYRIFVHVEIDGSGSHSIRIFVKNQIGEKLPKLAFRNVKKDVKVEPAGEEKDVAKGKETIKKTQSTYTTPSGTKTSDEMNFVIPVIGLMGTVVAVTILRLRKKRIKA